MGTSDPAREGWADLLRCLAASAVVVLHVSAGYLTQQDPASARFFILNLLDGSARWSVPVFFMLSGMFLLDPARAMPTKKWLGHVGRLAVTTLLWSGLYGLWDARGVAHLWAEWPLEGLISLVAGRLHYHLWFLPVLLCLYLLLPVLRALVKGASRTTLWYTVALLALVGVCRDLLRPAPTGDNLWLSALELYALAGYGAYFLLGWLLRACRPSRRQEAAVYLLGALGWVVTCAGTRLLSRSTGQFQALFYSNLIPSVGLTAVAVFLLLRRLGPGESPLWRRLSGLTLGVYLVHPLVLEVLRLKVFSGLPLGPIRATLLLIPLTLLLSLGLAWLLRRVPKLGRYLC